MEPGDRTLAEAQQIAIKYLTGMVQHQRPELALSAAAILLGVDFLEDDDTCDCWCSANEEESPNTETFPDGLFFVPNGTNDTYRVIFP